MKNNLTSALLLSAVLGWCFFLPAPALAQVMIEFWVPDQMSIEQQFLRSDLQKGQQSIEHQNWEKATRSLNKALKRAQTLYPEPSNMIQQILYSLSYCYTQQGKLSTAEPYLVRYIADLQQSAAPDSPELANGLSFLAAVRAKTESNTITNTNRVATINGISLPDKDIIKQN